MPHGSSPQRRVRPAPEALSKTGGQLVKDGQLLWHQYLRQAEGFRALRPEQPYDPSPLWLRELVDPEAIERLITDNNGSMVNRDRSTSVTLRFNLFRPFTFQKLDSCEQATTNRATFQ
eukprot:CAMPEP_0182941266 /NCGR_PEP_ID=MMETSP0105_2-20130417/48661_1 /TAXON_ID=81532 ORGANISM="Acanthoeca-like sp., Strain 10tr" /NCGR_SAMPLE_ID=MMETSP0105_2 /ASSEMBLY_ACC=CAM_ASM_000205 /LENGTH=117 /DNA_ID=CAMNT_0025080873 /DNA_START=76 /DNA_END=430 /DNA_ORIENTATION=+